MISTHWLAKRRPYWDRLESLLGTASREGIASMARAEVQELALLYRQTAADLSALREDHHSQNFARYVNQLLSRAHNIIYSGRKSSATAVWEFYRYSFPAIFRRLAPYTFAAFALFLGGAIIGLILTVLRPEFMHMMLGPHMVATIEKREMWTDSVVAMKPVASSSIMTNNLGVSFFTFASGITAGIGTLYLLVFNGLMLGVVGAACWSAGMSLKLWSFVAPHGVLELPAIFIAGGAGLRIAEGLLFPRGLTRRDSLKLAGADGVRLVLGTVPMLIVAGTIEGFLSPSATPIPIKFAVAVVMALILAAYVSLPEKPKPSSL